MPEWFSTAMRFVVDWSRAVIYFASWPAKVVKGVGILLLLLSVAISSRVRVSLEEGPMYSIRLEWIVFGTVLFFFVAVALGQTWVRFRALKVSDAVERDRSEYLIAVTNTGFADATVPVWLLDVRDENGPIPSLAPKLPLELCWSRLPGTPILSRGIPRKVTVFSYSGGQGDGAGGYKWVDIRASDTHGESVDLFRFTAPQTIWLKLAFGSAALVRWCSVRWTGAGEFKAEPEFAVAVSTRPPA